MTDDAFNEYERTMWEQRAERYADSFELLTGLTIEPLLDAARATKGVALLDVGTGPGFVAAAAIARGVTVTGVDVAQAMVDVATRCVPGATFRQGSAEALPFGAAGFDAVVGNFVLLHLGHPERALTEARRVLRPGGRAAFTVWQLPSENRAIGVFHDAVAAAGVAPPDDIPTGPPMFALGERAAFGALLGTAGFTDVIVTDCRGTLRVDPGAWWSATLCSTPRTGALIGRQTDAVQARIRAEYDAIVERYRSGNEAVLPVAALLASGAAPKA
jgi:SAM-dependent methyltransferase